MKEKLHKILSLVLLVLIVVPLVALFSPFILISLITDKFKNKIFKKDYKTFLESIDGKKFFCINDRKNNFEYVEKYILPKLSNEIEILYLENRQVKSNYEVKYMSYALHSVKNRTGFPYLLKVENGEVHDKSINKQYYNTKSQNRAPNELISIINNY